VFRFLANLQQHELASPFTPRSSRSGLAA